MSVSRGSRSRSISTAWTRRDALGEIARQDSLPGPISSTTSSGVELREAFDDAEDVRVDEEVLAVTSSSLEPAHSPKHARVRVDLPLELGRILAPRLRERRERVDDVCRLVRPAAHRLRREVRRVGLGEDPVGRDLGRGEAEVDRLREARVAGERDVPAALERGRQQVRRGEAVKDDRAAWSASAASVSSSAARVWITTGFPSSVASSSCCAKRRCCASRGA